jgi:tetratricopeptide (TPR) repeat protein
LVTEPSGDAGSWSFSHDLVRETILAGMAGPERCRLHARIAGALARSGATPGAVAHHHLSALPVGDLEVAIETAGRAAQNAKARHAHEEAAELLERAALARRSAGHGRDARQVALLSELAETLTHAGNARRTREVADEAARLAQEIGDAGGLGRAALAYGAETQMGIVDHHHVALLHRALRGLRPGDPLRLRVMGRLGAAMQPAMRPRVAVALARRAIRLGRRRGDKPELLRVLAAARPALRMLDSRPERMALDRELLGLARELGEDLLVLRTRMRISMQRVEQGDIEAAEQEIAEAVREAERMHQPHIQVFCILQASGIDLIQGRFHDAEAAITRATAIAERLVDPEMLHTRRSVWACSFQLAALRCNDEDARRLSDAALPPPPQGLAAAVLRAIALDDAAGAAEALASLEDYLDSSAQQAFPMMLVPELMFVLGQARGAEQVDRELSPLGGALAAFPQLAMCMGALDRPRAMLSILRRDWDEAERRLGAAMALNERAAARPFVAKTHALSAELLLRKGREADRAEARDRLEAARRLYAELGMTHAERQTRRRLEALSHPAPGGGRAEPIAASRERPSFADERSGWAVTYGGTTVRERPLNGLVYVAHLVAHPGEPFHVGELLALTHSAAPPSGDSGAHLDATAKHAYRRRARELTEELDEATEHGDLGRAERLRRELELLEDELSRALGLGGRERRAGSASERARANATQRIKDAVRRLGKQHPALGHHLATCIMTGTYCRYLPPPDG